MYAEERQREILRLARVDVPGLAARDAVMTVEKERLATILPMDRGPACG
jgi:hypothetical protein